MLQPDNEGKWIARYCHLLTVVTHEFDTLECLKTDRKMKIEYGNNRNGADSFNTLENLTTEKMKIKH